MWRVRANPEAVCLPSSGFPKQAQISISGPRPAPCCLLWGIILPLSGSFKKKHILLFTLLQLSQFPPFGPSTQPAPTPIWEYECFQCWCLGLRSFTDMISEPNAQGCVCNSHSSGEAIIVTLSQGLQFARQFLSALCSPFLFLAKVPGRWAHYYHYFHFTDVETESQSS